MQLSSLLPTIALEGRAGAAGLAAAVYAASEGLSVVVLDARSFGGQASASARIENYLGFPTGISGQALAGRAFSQAQKFGAQIVAPVSVERLDCTRANPSLILGDGRRIRARSVVVASVLLTADHRCKGFSVTRVAVCPLGRRRSRHA